jgi:hypothetical protein
VGRVAALAEVGARGFDSLLFSRAGTAAQAIALKAAGLDFFVGYLGGCSPVLVDVVIGAGLAFMPVTFANAFDGETAAKQCVTLGLAEGTTVWLDLEGASLLNMPIDQLKSDINTWSASITAAGFQPGLYIGSPQPFTGPELYALASKRYWKAPSRIIDRAGEAWDGPSCGFCCFQLYPSRAWRSTGVFCDVDVISQDFEGRVPTWTVSGP